MNIKLLLASTLVLASFSLFSCSDDEHYIEPPIDDSQMILKGKEGNDSGANMVYVNFEKNTQYPINRRSWHLGFYCGEEFRVTLNQSLSRAYSTKKTDFASVSVEDAEKAPNLAAGMMGFGDLTDVVLCDAPDHDLSKTVFGNIESDYNKSEVFLVATEEMPDRSTWFKVKVTKGNNGYKVEYGKVNDQTPASVEFAKDANKTFICFSLSSGKTVEVPDEWDIMWSSAMAYNTMPNGKVIYGPASDVITSNNYNGIETAIVNVEEIGTYDDFTREDLNSIEFHKEADLIGTTWRTAPMPGATPGPRFDQFYVLKDAKGNYYKFAFLSFCEEDGGERGLPELIFTPIE